MMTMLAAMERTKEHFSRLFQESGLQLRDVWTYDSDYGDSFIVAVPIPRVEAAPLDAPLAETPAPDSTVVANGIEH